MCVLEGKREGPWPHVKLASLCSAVSHLWISFREGKYVCLVSDVKCSNPYQELKDYWIIMLSVCLCSQHAAGINNNNKADI